MASFGASRIRMKQTMNTMDFASWLWVLFRGGGLVPGIDPGSTE